MQTIDKKAPLISVSISDDTVHIEDMLLNRTFSITIAQAKELEIALGFAFLDKDVEDGKYPRGDE